MAGGFEYHSLNRFEAVSPLADPKKPPSAHRAHYLVVLEGPEPGERFQLNGEKPIVIGRKEPADWLLQKDPLVSRTHCRVTLAGDQVMVFDLNSTNGTYLNGRLVIGTMAWPPGSRLEIGAHILEHEWS